MANDDVETLLADCVAETDKAWGVEVIPIGDSDVVTIWLPKSVCDRVGRKMFEVPIWLMRKHNLI